MNTAYLCAAQQRLIRVMRSIFDAPIEGVDLAHVATSTGISKPQALRDLTNLAAQQLAEKCESGRWRPAAGFVSLAVKAQTAVARAESQLNTYRSQMDAARHF